MGNNEEKYKEAIEASIENGKRLLEDSEILRDNERFPTAKALAILAQEEFAKAYIIRLVQEGAIPWCDEILRATKDHHCKQLMGIVMEYLFTPWDVESQLERERRPKVKFPDPLLPGKVADALNIFCNEKIMGWKSSPLCWAEDPKYDVEAKKVWNGKFETDKHNALYVSIGKDGKVTNIPRNNSDDANKHIEYAKVLEEVSTGQDWCFAFTEREYIKSALKNVFGSIYKK
jgi:AbiV family abortive infection protein